MSAPRFLIAPVLLDPWSSSSFSGKVKAHKNLEETCLLLAVELLSAPALWMAEGGNYIYYSSQPVIEVIAKGSYRGGSLGNLVTD